MTGLLIPTRDQWTWQATVHGLIGKRRYRGGLVARVVVPHHTPFAVWYLTRDGRPVTDPCTALTKERAVAAAEKAAGLSVAETGGAS